LFNKIVYVLPVQKSVDIFCLEDNEIIERLLGTVNNTIKELDTDTSSRMIYYIEKIMQANKNNWLYIENTLITH
jgi:hypothetical protein